jgi:hypothetical protein
VLTGDDTMTLHIRTNRHWYPLVDRSEVPDRVLKNEMDWTSEDSLFFRHLGTWYCLAQFERLDGRIPGWDGHSPDSFSSGVLVKLRHGGEDAVQVGTYYVTSDDAGRPVTGTGHGVDGSR